VHELISKVSPIKAKPIKNRSINNNSAYYLYGTNNENKSLTPERDFKIKKHHYEEGINNQFKRKANSVLRTVPKEYTEATL